MLDPLSSTLTDPLNITWGTPPALPTLPTRRLLAPSPTHPDDYILAIDNSTLEKFTVCPRRAENYSIHARESDRDQSAQQFGRLFHLCEELRLHHGLSPAVVEKQRELVATHFFSHHPSPDDHRTADRMLAVLRIYNERYANDGWAEGVYDGWVEKGFSVPLTTIKLDRLLPYPYSSLVTPPLNPHILASETELGWKYFHCRNLHIHWTGRIDLLLREGPLLWVVDHKTTSTGGTEFVEAFRLAKQTIGYCWAAQKLTGRTIAGCIINSVLIRKPLKTAKPGSSREEFDRLSYFYRPDQITEWETNISYAVADFVSCLVRGFFPMTAPASFKSPCVYCDYHENCRLPAPQRAADLACPSFRDVTWSPLNE